MKSFTSAPFDFLGQLQKLVQVQGVGSRLFLVIVEWHGSARADGNRNNAANIFVKHSVDAWESIYFETFL